MEDEHKETLIEKIKDKFNEAVGLPPGKFPDGEPKPTEESGSPSGTLTSDDTDGLPVHPGTGIAVE